MDVAALLYGLTKAGDADRQRKGDVIATAYQALREAMPDLSPVAFANRLPDVILDCRFGPEAEDSYLTGLHALLAQFDPPLDVVLCATLNHLLLQLNFQTRYLARTNPSPEVMIFYGQSEVFWATMVNANLVAGVHVTDVTADAQRAPAWLGRVSQLDVRREQCHTRPLAEVPAFLEHCGRDSIGCVIIEVLSGPSGRFDVGARTLGLEALLSEHTFHVLYGDAGVMLTAAAAIEAAYPDARVTTKVYATDCSQKLLAVVVAHGVPGPLRVTFETARPRRLAFVDAHERAAAGDSQIRILHYRRDARGGTAELVRPAAPFAVLASAPIPAEARRRMTDAKPMLHSVAHLRQGMVITSRDARHSTFLYASGDGQVITDYGNEIAATQLSPYYQAAVAGADGTPVVMTTLGPVLRVAGPAMPLTFTPTLHQWFSHFIIQCLPRVRVMRDLGLDAKFIVPPGLRAKQLEMLHLLGVNENRLVVIPPGTVVQADDLYVPHTWDLLFSPYTLAIFDELRQAAGVRTAKPDRRYLISREGRTDWRNLLTYGAIDDRLTQKHGFALLAPERMTLREEIESYHAAQIVVGSEGAGMYGAVYAQAGATYVTLADEDYVMPILGTIAAVRGFGLGYVFGESFRAEADLPRRLSIGHADCVVSPHLVDRMVELALARHA